MSLFRVFFHQGLNAFEILESPDGGVMRDGNYDPDAKRWVFYWGDQLEINWDHPDDHVFYLRFKRVGDGRDYPFDGKASRRDNGGAYFKLYCSGEIIRFTKKDHDEADWSFDFGWGPSDDNINWIDPEAKIKNPS